MRYIHRERATEHTRKGAESNSVKYFRHACVYYHVLIMAIRMSRRNVYFLTQIFTFESVQSIIATYSTKCINFQLEIAISHIPDHFIGVNSFTP